MVSVTITEKGGTPQQRQFDQAEVTVGRVQGNDIVLPKSNISKRHARIVDNDGILVVIDSKSTNGTYVNGKRIGAPHELQPGDKVYVGDFSLEVALVAAEKPAHQAAVQPRKEARQGQTQNFAMQEVQQEAAAGTSESWASGKIDLGPEENGDGVEAEEAGAASTANAPVVAAPGQKRAAPEPEPPAWQHNWAAPEDQSLAPQRQPAQPGLSRPSGQPQTREPAEEPPQSGRPAASSRQQVRSGVFVEPAFADDDQEMSQSIALPEEQSGIVKIVHGRLRQAIDIKQIATEDTDGMRGRITDTVREIVASMQAHGELPDDMQASLLIDCVLGEALDMGPLDDLLADPTVTEILVNGAQQIFVERAGRLEACDTVFSSDLAVIGVIERIVAPLGRRIDINSPMVDARLKDGSRVNAVIPPLAVKGPTLTIRKFAKDPLRINELVAGGSLSAEMAEFLELCVKARKNILVAGGTGSGKTTLLNVLSSFIGPAERIITIEDAAELKLDQAHVVSLESRPATIDGPAGVSIRDLVRNALRMRPDRIIVGECRGEEALDMLQAMNTGHDGSLTTVHANGPREALSRMETLVLMAGMELPARAIREQIVRAVEIIVQQARLPDGTRRITHISEITGMEGDVISMHNLFTYEQQGVNADGRIQGRFHATGVVPKFYEGLRAMGIKVNLAIFRNN